MANTPEGLQLLNKDMMIKALIELNNELEKVNTKGEICLVGGAALSLAHGAREATHDIDGIYEPKTAMRDMVETVAQRLDLDKGWLNDGAKGFLGKHFPQEREVILALSNLTVWVPPLTFLLAMKVMACRLESSNDLKDIVFISQKLGIKTAAEALQVAQVYFPGSIPLRSHYILQEMEEKKEFL